MIRFCLPIPLLLLLISSVVITQDSRAKIIEIPKEYAEILIVEDIDSPIELRNGRMIKFMPSEFEYSFWINNRSDTSVNKFTIEILDWKKGSLKPMLLTTDKDQGFDSGDFGEWIYEPIAYERLELSDKIASEIGLSLNTQLLRVLFVSEVELVDGRVYSNKRCFDELKSFLEDRKPNDNSTERELLRLTKEIRQKVSNLSIGPQCKNLPE